MKLLPWLLAGAAAVLAIVGWVGRSPSQFTPDSKTIHFTQPSPAVLDLARIGHLGSAVAISPDGQVLVWVGATADGTQLYSRHLDEDAAHPIDGTEGGLVPFFSPDSEWIGFWADDTLKKVAVRGGVPQTICKILHPHGASWGQGVIVIGAVGDGSLWRVDPSDGEVEKIEISNEPNYTGHYPSVLPGSRAFLVTSQGRHTVDLVSLETGEVKTVVTEGNSGAYLPTGHLVWTQEDNLLAAPFDLSSGTITGEAHTVIEGILNESLVGYMSHYCVSNEGTLAYLPGSAAQSWLQPSWVWPDGTTEPLPLSAGSSYLTPRVSPDGRYVLISRQEKSRSILMVDTDRGIETRLTNDDGNQYWAIWTPDSARMVFNSQVGNEAVSLWTQPIDLRTPPTRLSTALTHHVPQDITRDGSTVLYVGAMGAYSDFDINMLHLDGQPTTAPLLATEVNEIHPALSPDNRWLAYASDVTGQFEIYVQPFPDLGATIRVTRNGGLEPIWAPSGDRLYFRSPHGRRVFTVGVIEGEALGVGPEELLFEGNFPEGLRWGRKWDIHPGGDRFLMLQIETGDHPKGIRVITNWFAELERLVPTTD